MTDYGLRCTIHDLDSAVQDAVERAHHEYESKFYDWMSEEIEQHVQDAVDCAQGEYEPKFCDWMRQEIEQHMQDGLDITNSATILDMKHTMMSMQAELDFLHEKHIENVERRIGARLSNGVSRVVIIAKRAAALALAIIPTLTWKKNNGN